MVSTQKDPVLAVVCLSGGNDGLNTVIPIDNPHYRDYRPSLGIPEDQIVPFADGLGFHPSAAPLKKYWDDGHLAIVQGVGYPNGSLSHFRSMDVWATCEPDVLSTEGWLGRAVQAIDPNGENVLTGINFGRGMARAMAMEGVSVTSVGDLDKYGLLTSIEQEEERDRALERFSRLYGPAIGSGAANDIIRRTGIAAVKGADILTTAPDKYHSDIEYSLGIIGSYMRDMVQIHNAGFGTRIMFTTAPYNSFDTHANQAVGHSGLLQNTTINVDSFMSDLRQLNISDNIVTLIYSEFGRRAIDNGSGTDHGTGGIAFVIGEHVKGGLYGEYPSLAPSKLEEGGNLQHNVDFRAVYTTLLERWMGLDAKPIVGGSFETLDFIGP